MKYYIGLDMGTNSVGWCVTDEQYRILRGKGKDLWGVREFEKANGTAETRGYRVSRRRRQRETARLGLLKLYFKDEIAKRDAAFFIRLEESKYHLEDRKTEEKYTLFADHAYTDKEYFAEYPTIFHLRKELIENPAEHDVRLVYLAIANMFKHRGHFLNVGLSAEHGEAQVKELFLQLITQAAELDASLQFSADVDWEQVEETLSDRNLSRTQKTERLAEYFAVPKKEKEKYEVLKAICGQKWKPAVLFAAVGCDFDEDREKLSFSFRDDTEEILESLSVALDAECMDVLLKIKEVHDAACLSGIMKGHSYLSFARVELYKKHKEDLQYLKKFILKYCPNQYDAMFREMKDGNYSAYVGTVNAEDKKRRNVKGRKRADLYATIKKILKEIPDCEEKAYILQEMEKETFLPKQLTSENGIIPNQVHLAELRAILANAEKYLPFLTEEDERGLSVSEKICQLFAFQIPYYVGPLNDGSKRAWVVRKSNETVYPWNLQEIVDLQATSEKFIENLVGTCTYLRDEKVLPKASLLYEKYQVLNELNTLRVAGERLTVEQKQDLYTALFLRGRKVTRKMLEKYLIGKGILDKGMEEQIGGIDGDFKSALTSYGKFYGVFEEEIEKDGIQKIAEDIIFWGTVYGDDKKLFMQKVKEVYGELLTESQLKRIKGLKFKDWGKLSREFLELPGGNKGDKETTALIQMMWEQNVNLMELLSDQYTYADTLKERTEEVAKTLSTLEYEDLEGRYLSAPVKRMLWQTILVLEEVVSVMGCEPTKVFVEMAREDGEQGKRTISRKNQLLELYKKCKDAKELKADLETREEQELRQKKLYLYFMQKGKCMYTGDEIDIDALIKGNLYDIDHIYPRHYVKDDSIINNLVLVRKEKNAHKSDSYPIEPEIQKARGDLWQSLKDGGFISEEKYKRLTGKERLTDEQLAGFINRQLVETRQGTKALTKIMEMAFQEAEIVYVKAGLTSDFRKDFTLLKSRAINDFHHAQDAYLNIVVGNVYNTKFTKNPMNFIKEYRRDEKKHPYHMDKIFYYDVKRGEEIAWIAKGERKSIDVVRKMVDKNSPIITRMNFALHGELYKATLYGKETAGEAKGGYIPLKSSDERMQDVAKYGGFTAVTGTYFFLVEHEVKKKKVRTLEFMPLYLQDKIGEDTEKMEAYCRESLGMVNPSVRVKKIKIQSLVRRNGYYMHISGRTGNRIAMRNAVSLCLKREWVNYIKKVENITEKGFAEKEITAEKNLEFYDMFTEKMQNSIFSKRPNSMEDKLQQSREAFVILSKEEQCRVILELLKLTALGITSADLKLIGQSANTGKMLINKNITDAEEFVLIHQSPAGLYETEIDLLTV